MEFRFPESIKSLSEVDNLDKVKIFLKEEAQETRLKVSYRFICRKDLYYYFYCSKCRSKIEYIKQSREEGQVYVLYKYQNNHRHQFSSFRADSKLIVQFLKSLPKGMNLKSMKRITVKSFPISQKQFYYYHNKVQNPKLSMKQLLLYLESFQTDVYIEPFDLQENQEPQIMVLVSPLMKLNFQKYHQVCAFDCTFNIIKSPTKPGYKIGIIAGQSLSRRICPFAIAICRHETKSNFSMILDSFAKSMRRHPNLYISDQNIAFVQCLKDLSSLNSQVKHSLDVFHVLKNVKKRLDNKKIMGELSSLCKCKNFDLFERKASEIFPVLNEKDARTVERFINKGDKYIYSILPKQFIGLSSSDSFIQKCNDLLKQHLPEQKSFTTTIFKLFKFIEELGLKCDTYEREKMPIQIYYGLGQLKTLRQKMDKKVLRQLCKQLSKVSKNQIMSFESSQFLVKDEFFNFKVKITENSAQCECHFSIRSGIPCQHLLTILIRNKMDIEPHINPRWISKNPEIIENNQDQKKFEWRGRGKKTRRNIMR